MTTTAEETTIVHRIKKGTPTCGFCLDGRCEQCNSGVRNGDGTIVRCACKAKCQRSQERRCTDCNNRRQEEVGSDWRCTDREACRAEIDRRLAANPVMNRIRASVERTHEAKRLERARREAERVDAANDPDDPMYEILNAPDISAPTKRPARGGPKPTTGECLCCGEATRGGKFLPGHDSKFLTGLAERVVAEEITRAEAIAQADAISGPLGKKAQVRIDRAMLRAAVRK